MEAFDPSLHPRDDHGHFISKGAIDKALSDPAAAKDLLAKTTNQDEKAKLASILSKADTAEHEHDSRDTA